MDEEIASGNGAGTTTLQWPDYFVIAATLLISAAIGVYYRFTGGRQRTAEEYFSANRSMKIVPLGMAMTVSLMSAISILGISAEAYIHGAMFVLIQIGGALATPMIMYIYLPVFFELRVVSVYEYLEKRFGVTLRLIASTLNFAFTIFYTGIVLFAPSLALEATTGLSKIWSIVLIGSICTFYSTIGGIKAVLITDVFQSVLMVVTVFCVIGIASDEIEGGLSSVWGLAYESGRLDFSNFSLDLTERNTWFSCVIGGCFVFLSLFGISQVQVQRQLTAKNIREARMALILNWAFMSVILSCIIYSGLVLYAVYKDCDPVTSGKITSFDKILSYFAAEKMSRVPGFMGIFMAGVFSATLSTISATLNSLAAVALEDYIKPVYSKLGYSFSEEKSSIIAKLLATFIGISCVLVALIADKLGSLIEITIGIAGVIGGPLLGIYTLGMFCESSNEIGVITGVTVGLAISFSAILGPKLPIPELPVSVEGCVNFTLPMINETLALNTTVTRNPEKSDYMLNRISYFWYPVLGFVVTMIVGYIVSLLVSKLYRSSREPDPSMFTPFVAARIKRRRQNLQGTTASQVFVLEPSLSK